MRENLEKIKELMNLGVLKIADAEFYHKQGYQIVCRNGQVDEIIPPFADFIKMFNEEGVALC